MLLTWNHCFQLLVLNSGLLFAYCLLYMLHYIKWTDFWLCHSRLPGPSRVPAAGSSTKVQGASNLNRRSQSFNSIDKNKPPQYANGNEKGEWLKIKKFTLQHIQEEQKEISPKEPIHKGWRLGKKTYGDRALY